MNINENTELQSSDNYLAALDIGSNSFHFVLARHVNHHIQILHAEKYQVKLADGLSSSDVLSDEAINRGIAVLANLAATTEHLTKDNFRAVATFTLRKATNADVFLKKAFEVFPFDIEIISGHEEARLIYQAVNNFTQSNNKRLVIDIGGGSTECIVGTGKNIHTLASLTMGCISYTQQFFIDGNIDESSFKKAIRSAKREIDSIVKRFKKHDWKEVIGTSGTLKSIYKVINQDEHLPQPVTLKQVYDFQKTLIKCKKIDNIDIDGLKDNRSPVICAGVAIVIALMEALKIKQFTHCQYALREGVLFEQLDNTDTNTDIQHPTYKNNVRNRTTSSLIKRFNIDENYTATVINQVETLFNQVKTVWELKQPIYQELLYTTIKLHELGLDINPSGYQKHGQYIITHADLPGFNQEQQQALAWLIGAQRKKISQLNNKEWYLLNPKKLEKLCIIVRLSILLTQQRHINDTFSLEATATDTSLTLLLGTEWLNEHPLVDSELFYETNIIESLGIQLCIKANEVIT